MAALEKIRSKAVFLTVVIGLALLAFILGDALKLGDTLFGTGNVIAKVNGKKIEVTQWQNRYEEANQQMQAQGRNDMDGAVLQQQVLEGMIEEELLDSEFEALGITVSDEELTDLMVGKNPSPEVMQFAQQYQMAPAQLLNLINNPASVGATAEQVAPVKAQWEELKKNVVKSAKVRKYASLVAGAIQPNDLDLAAVYDDDATTKTVLYAMKSYADIDNKDYAVSNDELKQRYEKEKWQFKLDVPVRTFHYVSVDVKPSKADLDAAQVMIDSTVLALRSAAGIDMIRNNSDLMIQENKVRLSDVRETNVKEFIQSAQVGEVMNPAFAQNEYKFVKLLGKKEALDSVNISTVMVPASVKTDSVMVALNSGKSTAEVTKKFKDVQAQDSIWASVYSYPDSIVTKLQNGGNGYFVLNSSKEGAALVKVNTKKAPKTVYEIASISSQVYPSTATIDGLRSKLQEFVTKNSNAEAFEKNAASMGYAALQGTAAANSPQIAGMSNTRKIVQWLFGAEKGAVSPVYDKENRDKMIAVALDNAYEGYAPVTDPQVKDMLETLVRNDKKGEKLVAQLKGKNVAAAAQALKVNADTTTVTFGQPVIAKIGRGESELTAKVSLASKGQLVGPVAGNNGVVVCQVISEEKSQRKPDAASDANRYNQTRGVSLIMNNAIQILKKEAKIDDNSAKFF